MLGRPLDSGTDFGGIAARPRQKGGTAHGASTKSNLRGVNRLTDRAVKAFVASPTVGGKLSDGGGLYAERTAGD